MTGLQAGETLVGLDSRASNSLLYGVGSTSRLYTINPTTGAATLVGSFGATSLNGSFFGVDSIPNEPARLRVVSDQEQNLRINTNTGAVLATDTNIDTGDNLVAIAHTNNFADAPETTLYGILHGAGALVRIGSVNGTPNSGASGTVTSVGSLGIGNFLSPHIGFDIAPNGIAYASIVSGSINNPGPVRLYTINLSTGAATLVGNIGDGQTPLPSLTALQGPIVVTTTNDGGVGSLRQAILDANATPNTDDTITFNIFGNGPHVIGLGTPLPAITDKTIIDGTTEPDFNESTYAPVVVIDGGNAPGNGGVNGIAISGSAAGGSRIIGLQIIRCNGAGISIHDAPTCQVQGNYIGTDGINDRGNGTGPADAGVKVTGNSPDVLIGAAFFGRRNVISGNAGSNVRIVGAGASGATVIGNYIGTNAAGTAAIDPTTPIGVLGFATDALSVGNSLAGENVISGHMLGVYLLNSTNSFVRNNYIGTNEDGTAAIPNTVGVNIEGGSGFTIGGPTVSFRNLISGNGTGIRLRSQASNVTITQNYIGLSSSGGLAVGNGIGVLQEPGTTNVAIGEAAAGNVISGNTDGVILRSYATRVHGNLIGTQPNGTTALGNTNRGVLIDYVAGSPLPSTDNQIGSSTAANVIAFNGGAGVAVTGASTFANPIRFNSIHSNGGLGIDLGDDGVTANDEADADAGPNSLQNYPLLTSAKNETSGSSTIKGSLNAAPNREFAIDFYTSDAADPSGNGEGRAYLGTVTVTTDAAGNAPINAALPGMIGQLLTATAMDMAWGSTSTSEFSPAIQIVGLQPARLANISTRLRVQTGDNVLIGGLIITGNAPKRVMVRAIGPSLNIPGALADPALEIYDSNNEAIAANNSWRENSNQQEIIDTTIAPSNDLEAVFLGSLSPGAYTAVVYGVGETSGIGLVEVYDLDPAANSKLANIATRGFVQVGDSVLIGGLIITGETQLKLVLRGIGPSLDVSGRLADPTIELFNANGDSLAFNNNWRDAQEADINATGIAPSNDLESAILTTLAPAGYTAVLRGLNDTTGVGVVEIYALD